MRPQRRGLVTYYRRMARRLPRLGRRPHLWIAVAAATLAMCCCGGLVFSGILAAVGGSEARLSQLDTCQAPLGAGDEEALAGLDDAQRAHGRLIVEVGIDMSVPPRGWVIAVATAMQESGLRNLPHLGPDNDHDSLGLFQQRPSQGWGAPEQLTDPEYAATAFYERLREVDGWQQMPLTVAADAVQRSAYPSAYAKHEPLAVAIVGEVADGAVGAAAYDGELRCAGPDDVTASGWTRPAPGGLWSGFRTANRPDHYGIDIGAPRGTVVRAAADGVVVAVDCNATLNGEPYGCDVDGTPQVRGCGWYVAIRHGDTVTRSCHLLTEPLVSVGDMVVAGDEIGLVGSSGRSSGPHLHFEVEVHTLQETSDAVDARRVQTDPAQFLAARGIAFECATTAADCEPAHGDRVLP